MWSRRQVIRAFLAVRRPVVWAAGRVGGTGRHCALKKRCPKGRAGSNPAPGTDVGGHVEHGLGDGHISRGRRGVSNLHVYKDERYVGLNQHVADLMHAVKHSGRPHTRRVPGCVITTVSWKHWPCLFPQHGPGRKHERPIVLADWQREIVEDQPGEFLRGLFHSDGCRTKNWATRMVAGEKKRYDYPRWEFVNRSEDILDLCGWALECRGIAWRRLDGLIGLER